MTMDWTKPLEWMVKVEHRTDPVFVGTYTDTNNNIHAVIAWTTKHGNYVGFTDYIRGQDGLRNKKEKITKWVNIYRHEKAGKPSTGMTLHDTKEEAEDQHDPYKTWVDTVEVTWEE
jgi:hypothetical protein